jgi:HSP20 family protein
MVNTPVSNEFVGLRQAMDQLLNESFVGSPFRTLWSRGTGSGQTAWPLPLDVYATEQEVVVVAAVPGMRPEDLQVTYNQGTLTLAGTIQNVAEGEDAKGATWYAHELWSGQFRRSLSLPFEVDADKAEASFEHGIVRIVLPKAETAKPKTIAIKAGAATQAIGTGGQGSQS